MSYCYLLYCRNNTYIGATVNPDHRLRQHNGELVGGAKRTKGHTWKRALYVSGFPNWVAALQFEWAWKRKGRGRPGLVGKLVALVDLVKSVRSTRNAMPFSCWAAPPAYHWEGEARLFAEKIEDLAYLCSNIPTSNLTTNLTNLSNMSVSTLPELSHTVTQLTLQVSELSTRLNVALAQLATSSATATGSSTTATAPKKRVSKKAAAAAAAESTTESNSASATATGSSTGKPKKVKEPKVKAVCPAAAEGVIRFSGSTGKSPYIAFSPLYKAEFVVDGKTYGTVENYVYAAKYQSLNPDLAEQFRTKDKPITLRMAGNSKKYAEFVAPDYDLTNVYATAYTALFSGNESLRTVLLTTGSAALEGDYTDAVLGVGVDGAGQNVVAKALMRARTSVSA